MMVEIRYYLTAEERDVYLDWLRRVRDMEARVAIERRLIRLEQGNFSDHKFCRDGVWELRIEAGPGYRVYYARSGRQVVLLLCGGDRRTQDANIARACEHWQDWQGRSCNEG